MNSQILRIAWKKKLSASQIREFQEFITANRETRWRDFAWRQTEDPYHVVVSEIMLQQTQTSRVVDKFAQFIKTFPTFEVLARASQREVLFLWSGLGYNRRGIALQKIAQKVVAEFGGVLPQDPQVLETFPGIGPYTAGAICAFAFNRPTVFIETNIRAVYIQTFFADAQEKVSDKELLPLIQQTLDQDQPRLWYYALMDYGVVVKRECANPSRKSKNHSVQSKFEGSERQIRGGIIRALTEYPVLTYRELVEILGRDPIRVERNLQKLCEEKMVHCRDEEYWI